MIGNKPVGKPAWTAAQRDRNVEPRQPQSIRHCLLLSKVGQCDDDAVDLVAVLLEEVGHDFGVLAVLYRAVLGLLRRRTHYTVPGGSQSGDYLLAPSVDPTSAGVSR